ncbi:thiolase-like protein, partial [Macrophomina phaseolina]
MDCRMPGGLNSSDEFWEGLKLGKDAMVDIPLSRFDVDEVYDDDVDALPKGRTYVRRGGFLERAEHFDRSRFSIPEVQLQQMDPQQRILLETVDSALKDAGYTRKDMLGRDASVYIGVSCKDWAKVAPLDGAFIGTGAAAAIVSNRISFELGLSGTSMSIDTACSSSLVAVDLAVQALRLGRTDMAVAGGVNMILHPDPYVVFCQNKMLSPDGVCKTFDRDAKGYVRSEGCGVVILKRLSDALRDGNPVLGVITGSCSNQDGRSTNISAPSGKAQQEVVRKALRDAGRQPDEVDFVELHGTGTALGDPVEVHSLKAVFGSKSKAPTEGVRARPLYLGAVKTNIGHPEAAAGIAGLIKCLWVVQQRQVPPNIHLDNINPEIEFDGFEMARLPQRVEEVGRGPQRAVVAGCSSFGFGGTNVHVIVESPPPQARKRESKRIEKSREEKADALARAPHDEMLVVAFTGQGSQFASMAKELYGEDGVFAAAVDHCVDISSRWIAPGDLRKALLEPGVDATEVIAPAHVSQPSLFVMEYAIYQSLLARGIQVDAVLGHSIGEIVAAVVSGCLSLEEGLRLVCHRGMAMEEADVSGTMYAVMLPHTTIQAAIDLLGLGTSVAVAAVNGSNLTTVAGLHEALQRLLQHLGDSIIRAPLKVSRPFHSPLMVRCVESFTERIGSLSARLPVSVRFWSTVTATEMSVAPDVGYWVRHALQPVLFEPAV